MSNIHLAIDIGASSGRHILGWTEDGQLQTKEVYRFPNGVLERDGHLIWDIGALVQSVKAGLKEAFAQAPDLKSLSIDTWGVDYVLLNGEEEILPCSAYRDSRTESAVSAVHDIVPFDTLYRHTGCQFQSFNTIYQLFDDKISGRLAQATDLLMVPEYLMWKLTGVKSREYTNATTTGLVNGGTNEYDLELIRALGLPERLFPKLSQPGTVLGRLRPEIAAEVGGNCTVLLCPTHDTAAAVEGIPMEGNAPYISSGTWSLLGLKVPQAIRDAGSQAANFTNEGGVGYIRYQKNIMGMWLVNRLRDELCPDAAFSEITAAASASGFDALVDANADAFLAPQSMKAAFDDALGGAKPEGPADYFRCAYRSLAVCYKTALEELERNTGTACSSLYIVGGGAKNRFLNDCTEAVTGKKVIALPIEATALGNLKTQINAFA